MLRHTSQKINKTAYPKHQSEFLKEMTRTLDSLFGAVGSAKGTVVAIEGSILRAKCAPAIDQAREFVQSNIERNVP